MKTRIYAAPAVKGVKATLGQCFVFSGFPDDSRRQRQTSGSDLEWLSAIADSQTEWCEGKATYIR